MSEFGKRILAVLPTIEQIAEVAMSVAKVMPLSGSFAAGIQMAVQIANGIANEVPEILQAYEDIKTAIAGGEPITDEQWLAWQAQVDAAHADFLVAAQRVEAQP